MDLKKYPPVSIIIPNWNGGEKLMRLLKSIKELDYPCHELIIIDNDSTDGSNRKIKKLNGLKLIQNKENLGPVKALNQGFDVAKHNLLLGLDCDVILDKGLLKELVNVLINNPKAGMATSKFYYYDKPNVFNTVGFSINLITGKTTVLGMGEEDIGQFDKERKIKCTQGAVFLTNKEVLKNVGKMDESYFLYYSDADWALRTRKKGYDIIYVPSARAWHDGNTKGQGFSFFRIYHFIRSKLIFMRKHGKNKLLFFLFFFLIYSPAKLGNLCLKKRFDLLMPYFKGAKDGFSHKLNLN